VVPRGLVWVSRRAEAGEGAAPAVARPPWANDLRILNGRWPAAGKAPAQPWCIGVVLATTIDHGTGFAGAAGRTIFGRPLWRVQETASDPTSTR
jgi:hypothetical protein